LSGCEKLVIDTGSEPVGGMGISKWNYALSIALETNMMSLFMFASLVKIRVEIC